MNNHGPWKIRSSETKYKNPWIEVNEHQVIRPDGKDGIFGVVSMTGGVSVVPMDGSDVYLTQEFRFAIGRPSIEVVSGSLNIEESPQDAIKRELLEEIGAEAAEWIDLGPLDPLTSVVSDPVRLYLARGLTFSSSAREGTEIIKVMKMPFNEAVRMVMEGEITHAQSCVAILKAARVLEKGGV